MLRATVSGSFHRHMGGVAEAVQSLTDLGVRVLSPEDPRVVDQRGEFLFVASDRVRSVRLVQDRHLEAIRVSDFLWLVAPEGYVGQSASMEIGFAVASGVPILGLTQPFDLTLRQYVRTFPSAKAAVRTMHRALSEGRPAIERLLLDPYHSLDEAYRILERMRGDLANPPTRIGEEAAERLQADRERLAAIFGSTRSSVR